MRAGKRSPIESKRLKELADQAGTAAEIGARTSESQQLIRESEKLFYDLIAKSGEALASVRPASRGSPPFRTPPPASS